MNALDAVLEEAFPEGLPQRLEVLVNRAIAEPLLADFKIGPIVAFGPVPAPTRLFISDQGESAQWERVVRAHWGGAFTDSFLRLAPDGVRRMLDSDGSSEAEIYLDDLQDHAAMEAATALIPPQCDAPAMCLTAYVESKKHSVVSRHTEWPNEVDGIEAARSLRDAGGLWGLRWMDGALVSAVWVSEARWKNSATEANAVAEALGAPAEWHAMLDALQQAGRVGYPDAIEFGVDGTIMVTLGVLPQK